MKVLEQIVECRNKDLETALKTQQSSDMQDLSINKTDVISTKVCQTLGCGRKAFKQVTLGNGNKHWKCIDCADRVTRNKLGKRRLGVKNG